MAGDPFELARRVLAHNRMQAISLSQAKGVDATRTLLLKAQKDLERRLRQAITGPGDGSFTAAQMRAALVQVAQLLREMKPGFRKVIGEHAEQAAVAGADGVAKYLTQLDKSFRGIGVAPLALKEGRMIDVASQGAQASVLRRLSSVGEPRSPGGVDEEHPAKYGILDRYGAETVGEFEQILQLGLVTKKSWAEMRADITKASPFLQGAPAHWAARIVRTEVMGAYNRASFDATKEADRQLGDMVKILSSVFDDRTGADSIAVHGQIRLPDEPFETWYGLKQHPPDRPNDRAIPVAHRMSWPIPKYLAWRSDSEVYARWKKEKRKGKPPSRPKMTTIPLTRFGKPSPAPSSKGQQAEEESEDASG